MKKPLQPISTSQLEAIFDEDVLPIFEVLDSVGLNYFVDSGTLLGLVREGRLLPHDLDIDIAVVLDSPGQTRALREAFTEFRISSKSIMGEVVKLKIHPRGVRTVDFTILHREGEFLQYDLLHKRPIAYRGSALDFIRQLVVRAAYAGWKYSRHRDACDWPWRSILGKSRWRVPADLVLPIGIDPNTGLPFPSRVDEYLAFRYGDWRTPTTDWVFVRDDGGFKSKTDDAR